MLGTEIDWGDGRYITFKYPQRAVCNGLQRDEMYCFFFYNANPNNKKATIKISWAGGDDEEVVLPGGTKDKDGGAKSQGVLVCIHGSESKIIVARLSEDDPGSRDGEVECWGCSPTMGDKQELPPNGRPYDLGKGRMYHSTLENHHYETVTEITSRVRVGVIRLASTSSRVAILNHNANLPTDRIVYRVGSITKQQVKVVEKSGPRDSTHFPSRGGEKIVWASNARIQDGGKVAISLKPSGDLNFSHDETSERRFGPLKPRYS